MVNYKVTNYTADISNPADMVADVVEVATNQTVVKASPVSEARAQCRHLNFGGGFDGFTPAFFLAKPKKYVFWSEEDV